MYLNGHCLSFLKKVHSTHKTYYSNWDAILYNEKRWDWELRRGFCLWGGHKDVLEDGYSK